VGDVPAISSSATPPALIAQRCCQVRADQLSEFGASSTQVSGGALDDRGSLRPGGGERASHNAGDQAHPETTAPPEAADGTAAGFKRGGLAADEKRDRSRPAEVDGAGRAGPVDGRAHGEQAGRDEGRGADLAGQRERLVRQRDRAGRVTGEQVTGRGEGELCGGVGEVAAGPRYRGRVRPGGRGQPRGPTRSLIGCTLAVSQVKARQPRRQPPSIVASIE